MTSTKKSGDYSPEVARFLIEAKAMNLFHQFMIGQTVGLNRHGEPVYFADDVDRFLDGLKSTARTFD